MKDSDGYTKKKRARTSFRRVFDQLNAHQVECQFSPHCSGAFHICSPTFCVRSRCSKQLRRTEKKIRVYLCASERKYALLHNLLRKLSNNRAQREAQRCACGCFAAALAALVLLEVRWHVYARIEVIRRDREKERRQEESRKRGKSCAKKTTSPVYSEFWVYIWNSHFCHSERKF